MGNIGSQTGQVQRVQEEQWAHSFPRTQPRLHQHKVLPDRDSRQKLRATNNGEILQSGGTISGRQRPVKEQRQFSFDDQLSRPIRTYLPNQRDPLHKSGFRYTQAQNRTGQAFQEQVKRFGSEPDLRFSEESGNFKERSRGRKKYRAPPPPKSRSNEPSSLEWEELSNGETNSNLNSRKTRLFKTRAETKRNLSSPNIKDVKKEKRISQNLETEEVQNRRKEVNLDLRSNRLSLPEIKLTNGPDFQEELKEATKRLRYNKDEGFEASEKEKLKTLDPGINKKDMKMKLKKLSEDNSLTNPLNFVREEGSGKESSDCSPTALREIVKDQPKPFYFGMDDLENDDFHKDMIDNFASNLHSLTQIPRILNSSESDISSELEMDEGNSKIDINLQLRPILPKKQLEIPRFSPAAAWKLLSALDSTDPAASTIASDDAPVLIEDRIEKYSRPPPPSLQMGPRSTNDKSGDSGISGDAGPACFDDNQESNLNIQLPSQFNRTRNASWTPQQDLGDDSSLEEGGNSNNNKRLPESFINRPHVFSLSLPRDNHLAAYMIEKNIQHYTGLQKLKRSVSGVLGNLSNKKDLTQPNLALEQNDNWFLSKSAPNSLNNGINSLELRHSQKSEDEQPFSKQPNSGRVMYLPEFDNSQDHRQARKTYRDDLRERSKSAERSRSNYKFSLYSKSCENISAEVKSSSEPEDLQDPPKVQQYQWKSSSKPKKFTFQSTVRQIERKRLAEKLSREAEKKEKQRIRELEAMQKVEEEFQKKRAREKANIRQQLRLFSMDDVSWSSLPPNLEMKDDVPARPEPDGAASSSSPTSSPPLVVTKSPDTPRHYQKHKRVSEAHKRRPSSESSEDNKMKTPGTQILSEYRQPQRDYKEFRTSSRYMSELTESHVRQTTVHPQITCNMPKAKGQTSNGKGVNYRKDFAHGVKSSKSAGSSYSEDSQSRNNSPRMYHSKYTPITRF